MAKYLITVSRAELAKALALVTVGVRKGTASEVRFSVADGILDIMGPGAAHSLDAQGVWPSAVLADAGALKSIASRLPSGEPAMLRAENSRLYFGSFSIDATVLDIAPTGTQFPIGTTSVDILIAIELMGEARVAGSVGTRAIENANKELNACVDKGVLALGLYGVTKDDIASLVRRALQQKATSVSVVGSNQPV